MYVHCRLAKKDAKGYIQELGMSRAFGDMFFKSNKDLASSEQAVISVPDVKTLPRSEFDALLVLASDGVYDVMTNDDIISFLGERLALLSDKVKQ